jgi:ATP-dependent DNA helicase RecG
MGWGPRTAEAAASAGIATVGDLLLRFPHRHRDRRIVPVGSLELKQQATIAVEVLGSTPRPFRKRGLSIVGVKVGDGSDTIRATWFNQPWVAAKLTPGTKLLLTGTMGKRGFVVSEYEFGGAGPRVLSQGEGGIAGSPRAVLDPPSPTPPAGEAELVPVHPLTEGLKAQQVRQWLEQAVAMAPHVIEGLPSDLRARRGLAGAAAAVKAMHFPKTVEEIDVARERLRFEELFLYQAIWRHGSVRTERAACAEAGQAGRAGRRWIESLPFEPTEDQLKAFDEIDADLDSGEPMQRLLMGEVGRGKTVVALYSMLRALEAGFQAVLMAPTETLAEQHALTLDRLLAEEATPFALLTGRPRGAAEGTSIGWPAASWG